MPPVRDEGTIPVRSQCSLGPQLQPSGPLQMLKHLVPSCQLYPFCRYYGPLTLKTPQSDIPRNASPEARKQAVQSRLPVL
jgi:hypothetical protein